ncbi:hypothetical protein ACF0H5_012871 [Mactra antiquata]
MFTTIILAELNLCNIFNKNSAMKLFLAFLAVSIQLTWGYYNLKPLSYTQLPTSISSNVLRYDGINRGTATDAAFDFVNHIMYVVGETSHFMHVIDIIDPANPVLLFEHQFTKGEGIPKSVDVCGGDVAVALAAPTNVHDGHVKIFRTHTRNSGAHDLVLDGYSTVGNYPKSLKYTPDCGTIVITNEGIAGKDEFGAYVNPQGSVSIIHGERTGNPSVRLVDFTEYDHGKPKYNEKIRTPSVHIPEATISPRTPVSEDLEPEDLTISRDGRKAWVTLQENNAIAEIDINGGVVTSIKPISPKSWDKSRIDTSDRDGGIHRELYPNLVSLRQPGVIKSFEIGKNVFLFTGDEGAPKVYTRALHGFDWTDMTSGYNLRTQIETFRPALLSNVSNNEILGRLEVSTIDGRGPISQKLDHLEAFGGRGFSVWNSGGDFSSPIFDSDGTLEEYMEAVHKNVFNTDYVPSPNYFSPEQSRDAVSNKQGAQVTGLDIATDNGTTFLVVGTWSTGTLYLYTVNTNTSQPIPSFQSIVRVGVENKPWGDLYGDRTVGDLYITDLGIITSDHSPIDEPLLYVISNGGGSLSMYAIAQSSPGIPDPN